MKHKSSLVAKSIGLLLFGLIITTGLCFAKAEESSSSVDPERELIVMLHPGAVEPPEGRTEGTLDEFQITSDTLRQILADANVEAISRLVPDFQDEDRFIISRTGESVVLTDWTRVYLLRVPVAQTRDSLIAVLNNRAEIVYAEVNGLGEPDLLPNDEFFDRQWALKNDGTSIQGNGTPGADIKATEAWDVTTGSSSIKIAIVDAGMQTNHPDFAGRVTGDAGDNEAHGTAVAGVAAAQGNNGIGIAGVAWNVGIINEDYGGGSDADFVNAILSGINRGAHVFNNSWKLIPVGRYSISVRNAFAGAYKTNLVAVASMGNQAGEVVQYPSAFGQGIITVGATTNTDVKANYSSTGNWIDVTAPGGGGFGVQNEPEDYIYSTVPGSGYDWFIYGVGIKGTSFSAPVVSGIAALLLSYNPDLYNDDIEQIIRLGVEDKGDPGFDNLYGTGRVDARAAQDLLQPPNCLAQWSASGATYPSGLSDFYEMQFYSVPGLSDGSYHVFRYDVRQDISFPQPFSSEAYAWGRGVGSVGYSLENPNFGMGYCKVVDGSVTPTGCTVESSVYAVLKWTGFGYIFKGFFPCTPDEVSFAYTALGQPNLFAPALSVSLVQESDNHYFHVTWNDDNELHDGYELQCAICYPEEEPCVPEWFTVANLPATSHSYNYTPDVGSARYWFKVKAIWEGIESYWSDWVCSLNVPNSPTDPHVTLHQVCGWPGQLKVAAEYHHDSYFPPDSPLVFPDLLENPSGTSYDLAPEPGPDPPPCFPSNRAYVSWSPPENQAAPVDYYKIRLLLYLGGMPTVYWAGPFSAEACTLCLWPNKEYRLNVVAYKYGLHSDETVDMQIFTTGEAMTCTDYSHKGAPPEVPGSEEPGIKSNLLSDRYSLIQNRPNPFNPETDISYNLPEDCMVKLIICNMLGQKVRVLVDEQQMTGFKTVHWDGKDHDGNQVASGIYFYRLQAGEYVEVRRMILLR